MGLLSTKEKAQSTPVLIVLPILTIWFHRYCKGRYEPAFVKYPLQVFLTDLLLVLLYPFISLANFCAKLHRKVRVNICLNTSFILKYNYLRKHA